jgi:membrane protein DedA with SNARE-associated domain
LGDNIAWDPGRRGCRVLYQSKALKTKNLGGFRKPRRAKSECKRQAKYEERKKAIAGSHSFRKRENTLVDKSFFARGMTDMQWEIFLDEILNWITNQNPVVIWVFFFFSNLMENVFPPWPGDTITAFGGFLVAKSIGMEGGGLSFLSLGTSTLFGNLAGALIMYRFGHVFLNWIRLRDFPFKSELYDEEKIHQTFDWFKRNSVLVILLSRFSAGIRFFVSIVAGMVRMNLVLFLTLFTIAIFLWCGILIYAGYSLGNHWDLVTEYLEIYNRFIVGVLMAGLLIFFVWKKRKKAS